MILSTTEALVERLLELDAYQGLTYGRRELDLLRLQGRQIRPDGGHVATLRSREDVVARR